MLRKADCTDAENLKIYREELEEFLPEKILDFHVHLKPKEVMSEDYIKNYPFKETYETSSYTLEEFRNDMNLNLEGKDISAVCFGFPLVEYDFNLGNRYIAKKCDSNRFFPLRMISPYEDIQKVESEIKENRFLGYKPYLSFVEKAPEEVELLDMITPAQLELADEMGLIIMLHIPRKLRLADPLNLKQIKTVSKKYPNSRIVIAHTGRAYYLKNIVGNIEQIADFENVYIDLAMLNNWEVIEYLFNHFDRARILYGTDMPIAIMPGKSVEINNQYSYITPHKWRLSIQDVEEKIKYTSFLYEEIRAIKKASQRANLSKREIQNIFYFNGGKLLDEIIKKAGAAKNE